MSDHTPLHTSPINMHTHRHHNKHTHTHHNTHTHARTHVHITLAVSEVCASPNTRVWRPTESHIVHIYSDRQLLCVCVCVCEARLVALRLQVSLSLSVSSYLSRCLYVCNYVYIFEPCSCKPCAFCVIIKLGLCKPVHVFA